MDDFDLREENETELFHLSQEILGVVVDLQYPATPKSRKTLSISALLNVDITGVSYGIVYFDGLELANPTLLNLSWLDKPS